MSLPSCVLATGIFSVMSRNGATILTVYVLYKIWMSEEKISMLLVRYTYVWEKELKVMV